MNEFNQKNEFLVVVTLNSEFGTETFNICNKIKGMDYSSDCLSPESNLGAAVIEALISGNDFFTVCNFDYKIMEYTVYDETLKKDIEKLSYRKVSFIDEEPVPVFIYYKTNECQKLNHATEYVHAAVRTMAADFNVTVCVEYCKECSRYYIDYVSLVEYEKDYGSLAVKKILDESMKKYNGYYTLNEHSELNLYGYSAKTGGPDDLERRKILSWIIDNELMKKSDIIKHLEYLIDINGDRCYMALQKWQRDIRFLYNYDFFKRRKIRHAVSKPAAATPHRGEAAGTVSNRPRAHKGRPYKER